MIRRRDILVVLAAVAAMCALAGGMVASAPIRLRPSPSPTPAALPTSAPPTVIREGLVGTVRTLDPLFTTTAAERDIAALLFRGLTRLGPDGSLVPDAARAWHVEEDGASYLFHLRSGLRWHDGLPVTADDVVAAVATVQDPAYAGPRAADWRGVTVERVDRFAVRFRLDEPLAAFLQATTLPLVPAHLVADVPIGDRASAPFASTPVGNGPFRFERRDATTVRLVRSGPPRGGVPATYGPEPLASPPEPTPADALPARPAVDGYVFRLFDDADTLAEAFRAGELDLAGGLPPDVTAALARLPDVRTVTYPLTRLTAVVPNLRYEGAIVRDPAVRRGLSLAIDREAIVEAVLGGAGAAVQSPISPASFAHDPAISTAPVVDPAAARALLVSAGWQASGAGWLLPDGSAPPTLELLTVASPGSLLPAVASRVADGWRAIGIEVDVTTLPPGELVARLDTATFDLALIDVDLGLDPDLYPLLISSQAPPGGTNIPGFQSTVMDDLLEATRRYDDVESRRERFSLLQAVLVRELPIIPVSFTGWVLVAGDSVTGPTPRELGSEEGRYWDVLTWRLASTPNE